MVVIGCGSGNPPFSQLDSKHQYAYLSFMAKSAAKNQLSVSQQQNAVVPENLSEFTIEKNTKIKNGWVVNSYVDVKGAMGKTIRKNYVAVLEVKEEPTPQDKGGGYGYYVRWFLFFN